MVEYRSYDDACVATFGETTRYVYDALGRRLRKVLTAISNPMPIRYVPRGQGVNIYMEVMHPHELVQHPGLNEIDVVVHEIGHLFHGSHSDGGVMMSGGVILNPDFHPITLDRIRSIDYP